MKLKYCSFKVQVCRLPWGASSDHLLRHSPEDGLRTSSHVEVGKSIDKYKEKENYTDTDIDIVKDIDIGIYIVRILNLFEF